MPLAVKLSAFDPGDAKRRTISRNCGSTISPNRATKAAIRDAAHDAVAGAAAGEPPPCPCDGAGTGGGTADVAAGDAAAAGDSVADAAAAAAAAAADAAAVGVAGDVASAAAQPEEDAAAGERSACSWGGGGGMAGGAAGAAQDAGGSGRAPGEDAERGCSHCLIIAPEAALAAFAFPPCRPYWIDRADDAAAAADLAALVAAAIAGLVAYATMLTCVGGLCCAPAQLLPPPSELLAAPCPRASLTFTRVPTEMPASLKSASRSARRVLRLLISAATNTEICSAVQFTACDVSRAVSSASIGVFLEDT